MTRLDRSPHGDEAEIDIYLNFVDSLFADRRSMLMGLTLQVAISICVYFESGVVLTGIWPAIFVAATSVRFYHTSRYERERISAIQRPVEERIGWARDWETRYTMSSTLSALAVGMFAWFCLGVVGTDFSVIAGLSAVFAAMPTIVGRLYGSVRLAAFALISMLIWPAIILLSHEGWASKVAVLLFLPYISLVLSMVRRVRERVVEAVRGRVEKAEIAERFNLALTNMSHGVIMFDRNQRVVVINRRARLILQIPQHVHVEGRRFAALMRYARRFGLVPADQAASFHEIVSNLLVTDGRKAEIRLTNGVHVEFSGTQRPEGGSVLILEEVTERARAQERIKAMARFDSLTELPNRTHFSEEAMRRAAAADPDSQYLLIAFDVDDFKRVNDSIGHAQGDALLRAIARRLRRDYGDCAVISRLGGDEFMLFVDRLPGDFDMTRFADGMRDCLRRSFRIGPEKVFVTQSFGITSGKAGQFDLQTAMVEADLALYHSKAMGKGVWSLFERDMNERYLRRQLLKGELAKAIEMGTLSVRYQPIVEATTGRIVGCEALSRWHHPEHGNISPAEYIPLAEEMGIITKLTESVIRTATRECARWPDHVTVSVNLSSIDFQRDGIGQTVQSALEAARLSPDRLIIEITETAVISNEADMIERLTRIRETGVGIALDDFGTGYSSLSYLHRLPLDRVKIDRSFVAGIETGETPLALLHGITDLCHGLGLKITVEGVETASQLAIVRGSGKIDKVQGYLFGPALPATAIAEMATRMPSERAAPNDVAAVDDAAAG
ncbi:MAG: EAL domain-containing protein [Phyllobacteriaceae bacterium]|nr:EAL domain-containing protein [Phyllobacteriaceae bacterium]